MDKIIDKIRKLLALARDAGATEAEGARAMELATKLMLEHGISEDAVHKPTVIFDGAVDVDDVWEMYCVHAACALYGTKPIRYPRSKQPDLMKFVGRAASIAATEFTANWLKEQVERLYKVALPSGMSQSERAQYRTSFKRACASRVYSRACEIVRTLQDKGTDQSTALVVLDHRKQLEIEAQDFIETLDLKKGRTRSVTIKLGRGAQDGLAAGDQVKLQHEVR